MQITNGVIYRIDADAPHGTPGAEQYDGLKGLPLVAALNKLAELDYAPVPGAIDHGQNTGAPNYTVLLARDK